MIGLLLNLLSIIFGFFFPGLSTYRWHNFRGDLPKRPICGGSRFQQKPSWSN